jgi:uncharacterized Fe-S cluster protein YjdI
MEQTQPAHRDEIRKEYTNGEITVVWKPSLCTHSKICWQGLRPVFDPWKRPWVRVDGAPTERIAGQIDQCPSGALSYTRNLSLPVPAAVPETR